MSNPYYNMMNRRPVQPGSVLQMASEARSFMQNPMQYVLQHNLNLPNGALQNPYGAVQNMLNSGRFTQGQVNNAVAQAQQILSMMRGG